MALDIGQIAKFLHARLNTRVGGGECAHVATEALRVAGGDFTNTYVGNNTEDYDWGKQIARLSKGADVPKYKFAVGDIIQYEMATFSGGGLTKLKHHTQVVAEVDAKGKIVRVYEENYNNLRVLQLNKVPDLAKLTGGFVTVYRAEARTAEKGKVEFTVVNNTLVKQTVTLTVGTSAPSPMTLDKADTVGSFRSWWYQGGGGTVVKGTLTAGASSLTTVHGGGYEVYVGAGNRPAVRKL